MPVSANIYQKCLPAVSNDIDRCGAVSLCSIDQATAADLAAIYGDGDSAAWTINDVMLRVDYEAKACQIKQNSLYDLIFSMTTPMPKRLEVRDFNVIAVDRGEKAIEAANEHQIDIALVDLKMPGINGEQTLEALKDQHPWMEVVILTGHGSVSPVHFHFADSIRSGSTSSAGSGFGWFRFRPSG